MLVFLDAFFSIFYLFFWILLMPCFLILYSIFWIFMLSTFFIHQLQFRIFLIICFVICSIRCSIFHIFFFLYFSCIRFNYHIYFQLSFLFWIIMKFSNFSFQTFTTLLIIAFFITWYPWHYQCSELLQSLHESTELVGKIITN